MTQTWPCQARCRAVLNRCRMLRIRLRYERHVRERPGAQGQRRLRGRRRFLELRWRLFFFSAR